MTAHTMTPVAEEASALFEELGDVVIDDVSAGLRDHPLQAAAAARALGSNIGRIVLAGASASGSRTVQFNVDGGGGYSSAWPQWAFEIAETALVNGIKVWVLSNGDPFGSNLTQVILYRP
jgi:hypothetical protein